MKQITIFRGYEKNFQYQFIGTICAESVESAQTIWLLRKALLSFCQAFLEKRPFFLLTNHSIHYIKFIIYKNSEKIKYYSAKYRS